jgi:pimeloyl-ACP methyl ester carboxylesterase
VNEDDGRLMRRSRLRVRAGGDHKRGHRREKPLSLPHAVSTGAATKRVLDQLDGPFILVGHSYGASIMTVAGSDPKVKALVCVAALQLDQCRESQLRTPTGFMRSRIPRDVRSSIGCVRGP